jgi:hypothetical protein
MKGRKMGRRVWVAVVFVCLVTMPLGASGAGAVGSRPRISARRSASSSGWASSNWSGYAVSGGSYSTITGEWNVPAVAPSKKSTYSSNWIGIDGFNNSSLIQTGTEQDYYNGRAHYGAWWEILPAAETVIPTLVVSPGDHMRASIAKGTGSTWTITLADVTTGQSFSINKTYTGPQTSAEWIEEAPTVGGHVATLANYGTSTFDPGTVNGVSPNLQPSDGGAMIQNRRQVSTPSLPDSEADGFNAEYGSAVPPAPAS